MLLRVAQEDDSTKCKKPCWHETVREMADYPEPQDAGQGKINMFNQARTIGGSEGLDVSQAFLHCSAAVFETPSLRAPRHRTVTCASPTVALFHARGAGKEPWTTRAAPKAVTFDPNFVLEWTRSNPVLQKQEPTEYNKNPAPKWTGKGVLPGEFFVCMVVLSKD